MRVHLRYAISMTRQRALVYAGINQLVFPGIGTILAGLKAGYLQAILMLVGFTLVMIFSVHYLTAVAQFVHHPDWTEAQFQIRWRPYVGRGLWGLAISAVAWMWSLYSSWRFVRQTKNNPAPPPLPGPPPLYS